MLLEEGRKEWQVDPANQSRVLHTEVFCSTHEVKELLLSYVRLESIGFLGLHYGIFLFILASGTRGCIFSAFIFKFFGVIIVQLDVSTPLTPRATSTESSTGTLLSQISER